MEKENVHFFFYEPDIGFEEVLLLAMAEWSKVAHMTNSAKKKDLKKQISGQSSAGIAT